MSLTEAKSEKKLTIREILSGMGLKRKLNSMGIHINDNVVKVNDTKWGPILVQNISNGSTKLALGRHLCDKIIVDYVD